MSQASPRQQTRHPAIAFPAIVLAGLCGAAGVLAAPAAPDAVVTIHAQQYLWSDQTFASLEALQARLLPRTPHSVGLRACGTDAMPALLVAAHRFRHLELHLSVDESGVAHCQGDSTAPRATAALREERMLPPDVDDAVVRAWWLLCMP